MSSTLTPNMSLVVPVVGGEPGPDFAIDINNSLAIVDRHDHTPGAGPAITPAAININASLGMNGYGLTSTQAVTFTTQSAAPAPGSVYVKLGTEATPLPDLFYNDGVNQVQLTSGGQVNATIASLPGETYGGGTFTWKQGSGSSTPANFDVGGITLRPNIPGTSYGITVMPPSAIASAYTVVLPALPSVNSLMYIDSSGNITTSQNVPAQSIGQDRLALKTVSSNTTTTPVPAGGVAYTFNTTDTYTTGSATPTKIPGMARISLVSTGRPIRIECGANPALTASGVPAYFQVSSTPATSANSGNGLGTARVQIVNVTTGTIVADISLGSTASVNYNSVTVQPTVYNVTSDQHGQTQINTSGPTYILEQLGIPSTVASTQVITRYAPGSVATLDMVAAGTQTYELRMALSNGSSAQAVGVTFTAYEI